MESDPPATRLSPLARIRAQRQLLPENVRALGWVSFANDLASELAYPVVPLFLTITLGAPVAVVGLIEGIAEGIAIGLRGISGRLSDRAAHSRVPWIFSGYGISAVARPVIAAAPAWGWVLGGRVADRLGKAARTAPRDALIKDSTPDSMMGASFGYHRALDTAGAVVGPVVAVVMLASGASLRSVLWLAVIPGFFTLLLLRRVHEAPAAAAPRVTARSKHAPVQMPRSFWFVLAVWVVFSLGNSSDVFLLLRSKELGLSSTLVILAYAFYNVVYSGLSWPLGALSDRVSRPLVLAGGLMVFALVYLGFAAASASWAVWPLFIVYGVYIAATEGVARAWVADHAPPDASGTAYGIFAAATGASLLVASVVAGLLWSHVSPSAPFVLGVVSAALALLLLMGHQLIAGRRRRTTIEAE